MAKKTHTHRGTCQACGHVQAIDTRTGFIAKHGYTVDFGYFQGVCYGARLRKPAEHDVTLTNDTIFNCTTTAEGHDRAAAALKSGETVPETFERWNSQKVTKTRDRWNREHTMRGGYDTLPIAQATRQERADAINSAILTHQHNATGLRRHAEFLSKEVLTRFGKPLYDATPPSRRVYERGMRLIHNGTEIELTRPYNALMNPGKQIGWYAKDIGGNASSKEFRYTTRVLNSCTIPEKKQ